MSILGACARSAARFAITALTVVESASALVNRAMVTTMFNRDFPFNERSSLDTCPANRVVYACSQEGVCEPLSNREVCDLSQAPFIPQQCPAPLDYLPTVETYKQHGGVASDNWAEYVAIYVSALGVTTTVVGLLACKAQHWLRKHA